jgi:hypothetical protein
MKPTAISRELTVISGQCHFPQQGTEKQQPLGTLAQKLIAKHSHQLWQLSQMPRDDRLGQLLSRSGQSPLGSQSELNDAVCQSHGLTDVRQSVVTLRGQRHSIDVELNAASSMVVPLVLHVIDGA